MVYLDNNATTKIDRAVYLRQCEILNKFYGNPSSIYPVGTEVKQLVETARRQVASLLNADLDSGDQIIFTSCATESNNSVIHSVLAEGIRGKRVIISAVEHPSVLNTANYYKKLGCDVVKVGVDEKGILREEELMEALDDRTVLVSIGLVNSETGVIQDISTLTERIKEAKEDVLIHTDAVQAAGKLMIDVKKLGVDFLTISGHKFYAPKGIGALFVKQGVRFVPFLHGGHQEAGLRAGTENTASIVAMGLAAERVQKRLLAGEMKQVGDMRDELEKLLEEKYDVYIAGKKAPRVANTCNVGFKKREGSSLVLKLARKEIFVSSGTACNSGSAEPSGVLRAMGVPEDYIRSVRISLSYETTKSEIDRLVTALDEIL